MNPALVAQFWAIAVLLTLTPGADWAYIMGASARAKSAAPSILGMLTAYAMVIAAVALGVGTLVTRFPVVLTVLTVGGGAYLVWLGITALVKRSEPVGPHGEPIAGSAASQFLRGVGVSGINPKGLLLLLALLPQFTSPTGMPPAAQMLVLGALHLVDIAVIYSGVALLARRLLRSRPRALAIVAKLSGAMMVLIGVSLLVERFLQH
ncbi:LysE family translocator [Leifsonia sp. EB34]|uniref:LysE family translocator n=1 Tax=Leifsonia sp. EB34 TaxID=3156303 RepID=UPI0035134DE9